MDEQEWDARYESSERVWSGRPNGTLTVEAADLTPGQALDVGCGEGGDALWLAAAGWRVTAVDISRVALGRAASHSDGTGDAIAWTRGDLTTSPPPPRSFDLVSALYFPLPRGNERGARGLIDAVAPGGTLLYIGHDLAGVPMHEHDGADPHDYYSPAEIAEMLDDTWEVVVNESRPRPNPPAASAHHVQDLVLRARRTG